VTWYPTASAAVKESIGTFEVLVTRRGNLKRAVAVR
jgi:hypothetical protein